MPTMAGPAAKTDLTTFLDTSGCTVSKDTVGLGDEDSLGDLPELPYQAVGKVYQLHQEQDSIRRETEAPMGIARPVREQVANQKYSTVHFL